MFSYIPAISDLHLCFPFPFGTLEPLLCVERALLRINKQNYLEPLEECVDCGVSTTRKLDGDSSDVAKGCAGGECSWVFDNGDGDAEGGQHEVVCRPFKVAESCWMRRYVKSTLQGVGITSDVVNVSAETRTHPGPIAQVCSSCAFIYRHRHGTKWAKRFRQLLEVQVFLSCSVCSIPELWRIPLGF